MAFKTGIALLMFVVLAACSRNDNPDKWVFFSADKNNKLYYTRDKMSVSDEHLVKIWVKTVFNEVKRIEDKDISYSKNLFMIKCNEKRFKVNVGFNFTNDNQAASKTVAEQENALPLIIDKTNKEYAFTSTSTVTDEYLPLIPGSPADKLSSIVCK